MTPEFAALQALLERRHSCRAFLSRPVEEDRIVALLRAAQRTASWCNAQPWNVVVTRGAATEDFRAKYASWAAAHAPEPDFPFPQEYRGEYLERRRECGWQLYQSVGVERGDREGSRRQALQNYSFFGAPHVAIVTTEDWFGAYGAVDCGGYVGTFLLAAAALGLGAVAQAALASHPRLIREHFGLAPTQRVVCGISFGYEDADHPANGFRTARAPLEQAVRLVDGGSGGQY